MEKKIEILGVVKSKPSIWILRTDINEIHFRFKLTLINNIFRFLFNLDQYLFMGMSPLLSINYIYPLLN